MPTLMSSCSHGRWQCQCHQATRHLGLSSVDHPNSPIQCICRFLNDNLPISISSTCSPSEVPSSRHPMRTRFSTDRQWGKCCARMRSSNGWVALSCHAQPHCWLGQKVLKLLQIIKLLFAARTIFPWVQIIYEFLGAQPWLNHVPIWINIAQIMTKKAGCLFFALAHLILWNKHITLLNIRFTCWTSRRKSRKRSNATILPPHNNGFVYSANMDRNKEWKSNSRLWANTKPSKPISPLKIKIFTLRSVGEKECSFTN